VISEESGSLLDAPVDALVNAVNTVEIMGNGLALQFKQAYPGNFRAYQAACRNGEVRLGRMFVYEIGVPGQPRCLINFPTKGHWRANSKLSDIRTGLADLRQVILDRGVTSIAVPPLGCGNGGLSWQDVQPLIVEILGGLPDVSVLLDPPQDLPSPRNDAGSYATPADDRGTRGTDPATLTATIRAWNRRKERLFTEHHVRVAIKRLRELDWIAS
jgi:O-acetyl-ADP-ribose deacetylase (regulator of RNase III)